jgi:hypothetical protein
MPALISAIIFFLFAGAVANPLKTPPGKNLIPGIGEGGPINCIPADASSKTATLFGIPKPSKDNVPFVNKANRFFSCAGKDGSCDINPWNGEPVPDAADYVTVAQNVVLTNIWPDNDTTRLAKQTLPKNGEPNYNESFDRGDFRDRIYRPTCNDWCYFTPPKRTPALPYGGTFFCEFIFFYQGQNEGGATGERKYSPKESAPYPDDTKCDTKTLNNCPVFDVLIRKDAPVPQNAGGAAPGSKVTPLRCDLKNPSPTTTGLKGDNHFLAGQWIETISSYLGSQKANAQTETFINLKGSHSAKGEWIYNTEKITYAGKMLDSLGGREKIPEPPPILFRGKEYEAYFNLIKSIRLTDNILYLVETGTVDKADQERAKNNPDFKFNYLEFRRSTDKSIPKGKSLQLGTFPVATAKGWWELFPEESKPAIYLYPEEPVALNVKLKTKGRITVSDPFYDPEKGWNIIAYPNGNIKEITHYPLPITHYDYLYYEAVLDRVKIEPTGFLVRGQNLETWFNLTLLKLGLNKRETADFIQYWMTRLDENQPFYFIHFLSKDQIENLEPLELKKDSDGDNFSQESVVRADKFNNLLLKILPSALTDARSGTVFWAMGSADREPKKVDAAARGWQKAENSPFIKPDTQIRIRPYFKPLSAEEADSIKISPQKLPLPPKRKGFTLVEWGGILVD